MLPKRLQGPMSCSQKPTMPCCSYACCIHDTWLAYTRQATTTSATSALHCSDLVIKAILASAVLIVLYCHLHCPHCSSLSRRLGPCAPCRWLQVVRRTYTPSATGTRPAPPVGTLEAVFFLRLADGATSFASAATACQGTCRLIQMSSSTCSQ